MREREVRQAQVRALEKLRRDPLPGKLWDE